MPMNTVALSCKTMRDGVVVSSAFVLIAALLLASERYLVPPLWIFPEIIVALSIALLVIAPILLISTYIAKVHLKNKELK